MTDLKISQLPDAGAGLVTDVLPVVRSGSTQKITASFLPLAGGTLTGDISLGAFKVTAAALQANSSAGGELRTNSGAVAAHWGSGGSANGTLYGGWNYDSGTASTILSLGASKTLTSLSTATYPNLTELSYVKGVTSAIQGQITPTTDAQRIINARANKTGIVIGQSAAAVSVTGTTTETVLATVTVPAGFLGLNGSIDIITLWSNNNSVNNKTFRGRWNGAGGNAFLGVVQTTNVAYSDFRRIANRNSASSQIFFNRVSVSTGGWGAGSSASPTDTVNTASAVDVVLTAQLANTGDTATLEGYIIIGYPT